VKALVETVDTEGTSKMYSQTDMDKLIILSILSILLIIFSVYLIRCLGLFQYKDENERKEYHVWLAKEGRKKTWMSSLVLIYLVIVFIWVLVNF
jgi:hypothetical protein